MIPQIVISCNVCFRIKPKAAYPLMENIPSYRVNIVLEPLIDTGVDFAEPSSITLTRHRGVKAQKAYICLLVCSATKALHSHIYNLRQFYVMNHF